MRGPQPLGTRSLRPIHSSRLTPAIIITTSKPLSTIPNFIIFRIPGNHPKLRRSANCAATNQPCVSQVTKLDFSECTSKMERAAIGKHLTCGCHATPGLRDSKHTVRSHLHRALLLARVHASFHSSTLNCQPAMAASQPASQPVSHRTQPCSAHTRESRRAVHAIGSYKYSNTTAVHVDLARSSCSRRSTLTRVADLGSLCRILG